MPPNRVNRGHWPTKGNRQIFRIFLHFSGPWKKLPHMAPNGARSCFFLLIQTLPTFWAERILISRIFMFAICWVVNFPDFQIPGPGLIHFVAIFLLPSVCVFVVVFRNVVNALLNALHKLRWDSKSTYFKWYDL